MTIGDATILSIQLTTPASLLTYVCTLIMMTLAGEHTQLVVDRKADEGLSPSPPIFFYVDGADALCAYARKISIPYMISIPRIILYRMTFYMVAVINLFGLTTRFPGMLHSSPTVRKQKTKRLKAVRVCAARGHARTSFRVEEGELSSPSVLDTRDERSTENVCGVYFLVILIFIFGCRRTRMHNYYHLKHEEKNRTSGTPLARS